MSRVASSGRAVVIVMALVALSVAVGARLQKSAADPQCTINWTSANDGLWTTAGNWDTGTIPGPSDFACIPSSFGGTVTVSTGANVVAGLDAEGSGNLALTGGSLELTDATQPSTILNLALDGGTLTVDSGAALSVNGTATWAGGSLGGLGTTTVAFGATMTVTGTVGTPTLDDQTVVNEGTIDWVSHDFCIGGAARLNNDAEFGIMADGASIANCIGGSSVPGITNEFGTVTRTSAATTASTATIGIPFQNDATLDLESGILKITGDYGPTADSTFQTEIAGTTAGTQFGQLQVTGTATVAGFLNATNQAGFVPAATDSFPVITCTVACTGSFSSVSQTYSAQFSPNAITLVASPPFAQVDPPSLDFGFQATNGTTGTQTVTVTNGGGTALSVSAVTVGGTDPAQFSLSGDTCSGTDVAPGSDCSFAVAFTPTTAGAASATVSIADNDPSSVQTVAVSGTGVTPGPPVETVAPPSLTFTDQTPGTTSSPQSITVTNTGGGDLPISSVTLGGANPAAFSIQADDCSGTTVGIEQSCFVDVAFAPVAVGTPIATVTIADQADGLSQQVSLAGVANPGLVVRDLNHGSTAVALANSLVGNGVTISNVTFTGTANAAGSFSGGQDIIGFDSGIVLGSGSVQTTGPDPCSKGIEGPNQCTGSTTENGSAGDADLTTLAGDPTFDASVLEFDFVPSFSTVQFKYVFTSDEYNEFVNSPFNDTFAFFVNGTNCATVPGTGQPVSVNTINGGNPFGTNASNPNLYRNNSTTDPGPATINTEMDGLTVVLNCNSTVNAGVANHMKLAIADASDSNLDSNVMVEGGSLISGTQVSTSLTGGGQAGPTITVPAGSAVTDSATLSGANSASAGGSVTYSVFSDPACSTAFASGGTKAVTNGAVPNSDPVTFDSPGTFFWQASYSGDALNNAAVTSCTSESVTIPGTTTTTTTVPSTTTTTVPSTTTTTSTIPPTTTSTIPPTTTTTSTIPPTTTTTSTIPPTTTVPVTTTTVPTTTTSTVPTTTTSTVPTTTTTRVPTTTTTTRPRTRTTKTPVAVTTTTTLPSSTTTSVTATTTTSTPPPTTSFPSVPAQPAVDTNGLTLASPSGDPGSDVAVTGSGCDPGMSVQFLIEGQPAGSTVADGNGAFKGTVHVPPISIGLHTIVSQCGDLTLQRPFMVVLATAVDAAPSSVLAAVLAFFVLLGLLLLMIRPRVVTAPRPPDRRI